MKSKLQLKQQTSESFKGPLLSKTCTKYDNIPVAKNINKLFSPASTVITPIHMRQEVPVLPASISVGRSAHIITSYIGTVLTLTTIST